MNDKTLYQYLLSTDGVSQLDRNPSALDPASVKMDGRSKGDILRFLYDLSKQIRFYGVNRKPQGDWRSFFNHFSDEEDLFIEGEIEALLNERKDLPPHLALVFAFLHIFSYMQEDLNKLPLRRLNYYYEDLLQLKRMPPQPDQVHLVFELAKNSDQQLLKAGSLLDAGKTPSGLSLKYALDSDIVVSQTAIGSLKSSFKDYNKAERSIIYKAEDAAGVVNERGTAWRPFGAAQQLLSADVRTMEPAALGWAIASPNLFLAEGRREIRLQFDVKSLPGLTHPGLNLTSKVDMEITTEEGWHKVDKIINAELQPLNHIEDQDPDSENEFTLDISVLLPEAAPAVTAYNVTTHEGVLSTQWPVIRVLIQPESLMLENLSKFRVDQIAVEVDVRGVQNLILQNDQAIQPADKPVLPFGSFPVIGANFYIGSEEIFSKSLKSMNVNLEWEDPPEDLGEYYSAYGNLDSEDHKLENDKFKSRIELRAGKNWNIRLLSNNTVFNSVGTPLVNDISIPEPTFTTRTADSSFERMPDLTISGSYNHTLPQGFIRVVLTGPTRSDLDFEPAEAPFEAFGHKTFPVAYTKQAIALSKHDDNGPEPELPKQPYTPTLKSVTLDYTARDVFRPAHPNGIDQYFIQDIFGVSEIGKNDSAVLIPTHPGQGSLYIGLTHADAPQTVSFLFQIEEGSVPGGIVLQATDVQWSYLSGDQWRAIAAGDIIEDSTNAFQKPGLIRLNIGKDATEQHSLMPAGLKWLRASVTNHPDGAAAVMDVLPQAGRATLVIEDSSAEDFSDYEEHLSGPLAPDTITGLTPRQPSIKSVTQPYPSFRGRASESNRAFYRRVSERLRHKNRAVYVWDYERLVLESFPEIYKVKCLPHSDQDNELHPGQVRLAVVADWRKRLTGDPLQPRTDQNMLLEIAKFIESSHASPFASVTVSNPFYETLLVDCKISFHTGYDPGYFSSLLDEELKKFLSPWAYDEGQDIVFGGKVHASDILAFIEEREYVDYVVDFDLYHRHGGHIWQGISEMEIGLDFIIAYTPASSIASSGTGEGGKTINLDFVVGEPVEMATATRPDTILVSNAFHRILPLREGASVCRGVRNIGIGEMIIGIDFVPVS